VYRAAVLEKFVRPAYPITAKRMHIEGDVVLKLNVASDGSVQGIKILSGNSVLARAAMEAAQQWRYRPALLNGAPTSAEAKTVLTFRVDDDNN
jgi:protein TonB